jgi:5'-3' exonuclease
MNKSKSIKNKVILIDTSDMIFNTFFKVYNIYQNKLKRESKNIDDVLDLSVDEIFVHLIKRELINSTKRLKYKYDVLFEKMFYIRDSPMELTWRKQIYEDYKEHRKTTKYKSRSFNMSGVFKKIYGDILPEVARQFKINILMIPTAEADDTISVIVRDLPSHIHVYIISSDTDYLQLLDRRNTHIYGLNGEYINKKLFGLTAEKKLLQKVLYGDKSDNIPPCLTDINMIKSYMRDQSLLTGLLKNDGDTLEKYHRNRELIDFNFIPYQLQNKIKREYRKLIVC